MSSDIFRKPFYGIKPDKIKSNMAKIDLNFECKEVRVNTGGSSYVSVEIEKVEVSEILDNIKMEDVIDHYEDDKILYQIGIDRIKDYFDMVDSEE